MVILENYQIDPGAFAVGFGLAVFVIYEAKIIDKIACILFDLLVCGIKKGFALVKRKFGKEK